MKQNRRFIKVEAKHNALPFRLRTLLRGTEREHLSQIQRGRRALWLGFPHSRKIEDVLYHAAEFIRFGENDLACGMRLHNVIDNALCVPADGGERCSQLMRHVLKKGLLLLLRLSQLRRHIVHRSRKRVKFNVAEAKLTHCQVAAADFACEVGQALYWFGKQARKTATQDDRQQDCREDHYQQHQIDLSCQRRDRRDVDVDQQNLIVLSGVLQC